MTKFKPTDSELEILHILWEKGASSVRDINDLLNTRRDVGYTTTLKLMQIMNEKGLVKRDTAARTHIYKAVVRENETKNNLISDFVNVAFQGSAMNLVMQALGNTSSSVEELSELKSLIAKLENKS
ncbi:MAG: BlaI/MecI/CopY family transcriptional regulator [Saprospiraceae bacterium]|jgi:BlaI family penicillinase repressor|nr:BlaI/MecI/CopY family transcriptional regulator [Saprospiraceae bacterium]MBP6238163.1 BlaI/MecI/CopY family transcriptional regulator [Saprospiraceae bacterium]MBP6566354.1 BlaI/MecI/CopY family transcriptional regulator [Saprospiraceae bacterium]MBP9198123.1 BlaI/MecI/CopY family transcriptional regulator [Saprospiraceae bacterium]